MELVDNIVLFSDVVYTLLYDHLVDDSVIYIIFQVSLHYRLLQEFEYRSLCHAVNPCCSSVLDVVVCICQSLALAVSLSPPPFPFDNRNFVL